MPVTSFGGEGGVCARVFVCVCEWEKERAWGEGIKPKREEPAFLFFIFYPEDQMTFAFFLP